MIYTRILVLIAAVFLLIGCWERNSDDPNETYRMWSDEDPPENVEVIHGKYWQSAHFTKEYTMYMELNAPPTWRKEFIKQNRLVPDSVTALVPDKAPYWFKPAKKYKAWVPKGFNEGSVYFEDTVNGNMFLYEIQL